MNAANYCTKVGTIIGNSCNKACKRACSVVTLQSILLDIDVLGRAVINQRGVEGFALVADIDVIEGKVGEAILVGSAHVEKVLGGHLDVADGDVVALRQGHVLTILGLEELCPGTDDEERAALALDVLDGNVLVVLGGIGTHLQPEHTGGRLDIDATKDDVAVVE